MADVGQREKRAPAGAALLQTSVTDAIAAAALEELATSGYGAFALESVAKRAGVGKTSIYRRYKSKRELVLALLVPRAIAAIEIPNSGNLRTDLRLYLEDASNALMNPLTQRIMPDILAEAGRDPEFRAVLLEAVIEPRRHKAGIIIRSAIADGQLGPHADIDLALDFIGGPLYWRLMVIQTPISPDYLDQLTEMVLSALRFTSSPLRR